MLSCTRIVSVPRHERPSTLSCFDYDVGVRILYKSFGFPLPLGGSSGRELARLETEASTNQHGDTRGIMGASRTLPGGAIEGSIEAYTP